MDTEQVETPTKEALDDSLKFFQEMLNHADIQINGTRPHDMKIHNPKVFKRVLAEDNLGLGEAYMDGWWDCDRLDIFFDKVLRARLDTKLPKNIKFWTQLIATRLFNMQSKVRSLQVADVHYNLDNALYEKMLGPTMAYTCGYWKNADTLEDAQYAKYDLVCKKLDLKETDEVLELGCGWGGLSRHAATHYGCKITAVNISKEQVKFAREITKDLPVEVIESDYRDMKNYNPQGKQYDKIMSVGMCEHVGYKNYHGLFELAQKQLKPQSLFLMHTIGGNRENHRIDPWIGKYIFPHGQLPAISQLSGAYQKTKMILEDFHNFGADYDTTLMAWYHNFIADWPNLKDKYDERFFRMWSYYLLSCAGLFRAREAQLWQFVFSNGGVDGVYQPVR